MLTCNDSESESEDNMTVDPKIPESQDPLGKLWKVNPCQFSETASFIHAVSCIPATKVYHVRDCSSQTTLYCD